MTEQQQAAMRQALEVIHMLLENYVPEATEEDIASVEKTITALRQALEQKPVNEHQDWCASLTRLLTSMPPQPAPCNCKPEQQPAVETVASYKGPEELWLQLHGDCSDDELETPVDYTDDSVTWCWHQIHHSDVRYVRADLTSPQPAAWVGLTEEEIQTLVNKVASGEYQYSDTFALAIEAKLRGKNA